MIMRRMAKGSNQEPHASCTNGMFYKFNMLSASKQAVHNEVVQCLVRGCSNPW